MSPREKRSFALRRRERSSESDEKRNIFSSSFSSSSSSSSSSSTKSSSSSVQNVLLSATLPVVVMSAVGIVGIEECLMPTEPAFAGSSGREPGTWLWGRRQISVITASRTFQTSQRKGLPRDQKLKSRGE